LQLTLDLITPKEDVAEIANYQHPLKNFRDLAIANGTIFKEDDMGVLRRACRIHGLNQAGWRFLNRYGESAYEALFSMVEDIDGVFEIALCYVNWQCRAGLKKPLANELGKRFIICLGGIYEMVPEIDPRILKVANEYWNKLADPAERLFFAQDEWLRVLGWMRDKQPTFDRNQWRSGWGAIRRNYQKWQRLNPEPSAWHSLLPAFDQGGLRVRPLTSTYDLAREAYQMQHCVEDYAKYCLAGNYRLFSISDISSGRALATASLVKDDAYWKIDQIKGRFNKDPEARAAKLGRVIQKKYMQQEELIARREILEHQRCMEQLRAEHEVYLRRRQVLPKELQAEFSSEEIIFLEKHAAWLGALSSGQLQPNACEQVRFIAVSNGILLARTEPERIWKRLQRLCNALGHPLQFAN